MGRTGSGLEIRAKSMRLEFMLDGQRQRHTIMLNGEPMAPTPPNIKYATRLAAEIKDRIRHGTFSLAEYFPASGAGAALTSVEAQLTSWLDAQRIEASTRKGYQAAINFWTGAIGTKPLRSLKTGDILAALGTKPDLSGKTVNNYVSVLREALELAVIDNLMPANPVEHVPRAKYQKPPIDPFTRAEAEAIIADALKHHPGPIHNLIEWWFWSGVRTSEMAGLHWPQVDFASSYMQIREALVRGVEKSNTKTNEVRDVHLNSRALAALTRQKVHTYLAGEHVWTDPRYGASWSDERAFRRSYWTPILKRLGIRYRRPYQMRHTYATLMLMSSMAPAYCAGQMGHSIEIFLSTYAKWIPGAGDAAEMAKLEQTIDSPLATPQEKRRQS